MVDKIRGILAGGMLLLGILLAGLAYREHQPFAMAKVEQKAIVQTVIAEPEDGAKSPMDRKIDFTLLKKINPDIIGWLYIPQIDVDQPILKGSSDTEYLNKNFEGEFSPLGSIFTWAHADELLADSHLCLFGHNMMSGQMFGRLDEFADAEFREQNSKLYLYTPERSKELEVEAVFTCQNQDEVFQDDWENESDRQTVTLATCTGFSRTAYRFVVNCRVVEELPVL